MTNNDDNGALFISDSLVVARLQEIWLSFFFLSKDIFQIIKVNEVIIGSFGMRG